MTLYPFKFNALDRDHIWGTEIFLLSGMEGDITEVSEGYLSENSVNDLAEVYMGDMLGDSVYDEFSYEFPLVIKELHALDNLSVQVSPDDKLAASKHNAYGKCSLWYVTKAREGAVLYMGFTAGVTRESYLTALAQGTVYELLNKVSVKEGDVFFIPSGLVHAVGGGVELLEIQQASDVSYRIFDWGRDVNTELGRELHTDLALEAIDFTAEKPANLRKDSTEEEVVLNANPHFMVEMLNVTDAYSMQYNTSGSFVVLLCISGAGEVEYDTDGIVDLNCGELVLIPAECDDTKIYAKTDMRILKIEPSQLIANE